MAYSHGRLDQYEPSYFHIKIANKKSDKPQIDWIEYAFSLAMKLELLDDAEDWLQDPQNDDVLEASGKKSTLRHANYPDF